MKVIKVTRKTNIPLIGCIAFGLIDRGSNLLQVRPTSACNLECKFCSVSAHDPNIHPVEYYVDIDYLLQYVKEVVKFKGDDVIIFIDSVGEPLMHPQIKDLIKGLKKIKGIKKVVIVTNGVLLSKKLIDELEKIGLDQINLSLNSFDKRLACELAGCDYNVKKVVEITKYINKSKIDLMITPIWIPKINDEEIIKIIKFVKELKCGIGLQKYEEYRYSRKVGKAKKINYYKFYKKLEEWEKEFGVKLKVGPKDFGVEKRKRIPAVFKKGEKIQVDIVGEGWFRHELLGVAKNRCITVVGKEAKIGDRINVKIVEDKNNIYIAK